MATNKNMFSWHYPEITRNFSKCWPYILGVAGIFMMLTMGAVLVTEGCRKIKLQYYGFKLASGAGNESHPITEVEPYIPFNISPTGMQPLLTTSYLLAFPSIMAREVPPPVLQTLPPRRKSHPQPQEFTIWRSERLAKKSRHRATKPVVQAQNVLMKKLGITSDTRPPDASSFQQFTATF
ncbi:preprotein translocase subunit SCY2, chloroplastic-like [Panicum virgatum]|uniref:preprotein translocase subunit SCY2, chloroplastic-like n=1 Tax=Panicum virgatum TaxID=38727 RepID=UPI0019D65DFF|nr:preprotein translocase subunit SCY2, chloroplastic-like [Panicum virgatum]